MYLTQVRSTYCVLVPPKVPPKVPREVQGASTAEGQGDGREGGVGLGRCGREGRRRCGREGQAQWKVATTGKRAGRKNEGQRDLLPGFLCLVVASVPSRPSPPVQSGPAKLAQPNYLC